MSRFQDPAGAAPLVRDLVRDYCTVYLALLEQSNRLSRDKSLSYNVLHALMGEAMRKGVFWRLKDTAHHLFRRTGTHRKRQHQNCHTENRRQLF